MIKKFNFTADSFKDAVERMKADNQFSVGSQAGDWSEASNVNFDELSFNNGDVILVAGKNEIEQAKFANMIPGASNPARGILVQVIDNKEGNNENVGTTKRLYMNSTRKRVAVYDEATKRPVIGANGQPKVVYPKDNDFYRQQTQAPTVQAMLENMCGKAFLMTELSDSPCRQARRNAQREVVDTSLTHVYAFKDVSGDYQEAAAGAGAGE